MSAGILDISINNSFPVNNRISEYSCYLEKIEVTELVNLLSREDSSITELVNLLSLTDSRQQN